MRQIGNLLMSIWAILIGIHSQIKDFVIPVLQFLEVLKNLNPAECGSEFDYKGHLMERIKSIAETKRKSLLNKTFNFIEWATKNLEILITAFINAIKTVCPEEYKALKDKKHLSVILWFANLIKTAEKARRSYLLFKVASCMVKEIYTYKDEKLRTNEADYLVQYTYSLSKHKDII